MKKKNHNGFKKSRYAPSLVYSKKGINEINLKSNFPLRILYCVLKISVINLIHNNENSEWLKKFSSYLFV